MKTSTVSAVTLSVLVFAANVPPATAQDAVPVWENRSSGPIATTNASTTSIEFDSDGSTMLQSLPEAYRRWEVSTGQLLSVVRYDYRWRNVAGAAYSPDGRYILARMNDYTLHLIESWTGRTVDSMQYYGGMFNFTSDGSQLVLTTSNRITYYSIPQLDLRRQLEIDGPGALRLAPDDREFLGLRDGLVVQHDTATGAEIRRLAGLANPIYASHALSSEYIIGYSRQWIAIWSARTGERLSLMSDRSIYGDARMVMNNGGRLAVTIATGGQTGDSTMRVWDVRDRRRIHDFAIDVQFPLLATAVTPDERYLVALESSGTFAYIEMTTGRVARRVATGHRSHGTSVASSRDGRFVVTGGFGSEIRMFDRASGAALRTMTMGSWGYVDEIDVTSDGRIIAAAMSGTPLQTTVFGIHAEDSVNYALPGTNAMDISPDDQRIAVAGGDGSIGIYELRTGREVMRLTGQHGGSVTSLVYSPDGRWLASAGADLAIVIWNLGNGDFSRTFGGHTRPIYDLVFTRDSREVISVSGDGRVLASDIGGGQRLLAMHPGASVGVSADGRTILVGSTIMITLDRVTGMITQRFDDPLRLGYGGVHVDAYPPTATVATVSTDGDVVAWSVDGVLSAEEDDRASRIAVVTPSPATDHISVALPPGSQGPLTLSIADMHGDVRLRVRTDHDRESIRVSIRDLEAGIYVVTLQSGEMRSHHKIVVQR